MKDQEPQRNGSFADADLATECTAKLAALTDNLKALADEGLTPAMLTAFEKQITAFQALPTDENLLYTVVKSTAKRDAALEAARTGLRQVSQPIARAYGNESPEYRSLAIGEVTRKTVPETLQVLLTAPGVGTVFVDDKQAQDQGFSAARLAALAPLYADLFACEGKMHAAETARTGATRSRVLAYNALNTECSSQCARGYDHFVELDASKARLFVRNLAGHADTAPPTPNTQA
ncbi:hypothetical protein [Hymenobacter terricola]|uniref:hypothetical protein n=1 Tax=Hymenobacter terricola TaxID=2819236 RepID=UPI001B30996B|nr:hypothetical protein [Hymenobacter terricola]